MPPNVAAAAERPLVLAFGSCRKQRNPQPWVDAVARLKPDAFIWTGDYLYFKPPKELINPQSGRPAVAVALEENYAMTAATEAEKKLRASVPIIDGVYDDHDYGENDAGRHFEHRDLARRLFLDSVVDAPIDSPRRTQLGGIYGARTFGEGDRQVKLLMLDTRYARDDYAVPSPGGVPWLPSAGSIAGLLRSACALLGVGSTGDMLGSEEQWQWLEGELANSSAAVHLIVSSVQVCACACAALCNSGSVRTGGRPTVRCAFCVQVLSSSAPIESWGHFPASRRRLLHLLAENRPAATLLLSGDVHFAELLGLPAASTAGAAASATADASTRASTEGGRLLEVSWAATQLLPSLPSCRQRPCCLYCRRAPTALKPPAPLVLLPNL